MLDIAIFDVVRAWFHGFVDSQRDMRWRNVCMCMCVHDLQSHKWSQKQETWCTRKYDKDDKSDVRTRNETQSERKGDRYLGTYIVVAPWVIEYSAYSLFCYIQFSLHKAPTSSPRNFRAIDNVKSEKIQAKNSCKSKWSRCRIGSYN